MGLPCKHRLASLIKSEQPILLAEIHLFWRIGLDSAEEAYLPPLLNPRPGTTQRSNQTTDNGGVVGPLKKPKAPRKCSNCGEIGHSCKTCPIAK
jgi:hypothetical protein